MFFWWVILIFSAAACIVLAGYLLPKKFLKTSAGAVYSADRGIRNFKENDGRSIVYEPAPQYRKYISQYILSFRQSKKTIICKLTENFAFIDYDIVILNCYNQLVKIINVKENIKTSGFTCLTELPKDTAYISLKINFIDNIDVTKEADAASNSKLLNTLPNVNKVSARRITNFGPVIYALVTGVLVILEVFIVKLAISNIFGDVFWEDFMMDTSSMLITLATGIVAAGVFISAVIINFVLKNKKDSKNRANQK